MPLCRMVRMLASALLVTGWLVAGCGDDDGDGGGTPDAAAEVPDAGPTTDAAYTYPSGPFGTGPEDTIENLSWVGFVDDDGDGNPFNQEPRIFYLAEYYAENDPDAKVIMVNAAAGWCGPCQQEAYSSGDLMATYYPKGARFVSAVFEDSSGNPATRDFVKTWGQTFQAKWPLMVDATFLLGKYFDQNAMPMNMFVDARTMKILTIYSGYDDQFQRNLLDYYTSTL